MNISTIMSTKLVTVEMDDSLNTVKAIFDNTRFHHLLVMENAKLFGVVSDRDLLKAISPNIGMRAETSRDSATLNKKVHQVMTRTPITLGPEATILDSIDIFNRHTVSCIPIVDADNKPVGIVSWRDILKNIDT